MQHTSMRHLFLGALIAQSLLIAGTTNAQQWTTIAASNQPAPGLPSGSLFSGGFGDPSIDSTGRITFTCTLHDSPFAAALWATGANGQGLFPALHDDQPAPGSPDIEYQIPLLFPHLAENGGIVVTTQLNGANH